MGWGSLSLYLNQLTYHPFLLIVSGVWRTATPLLSYDFIPRAYSVGLSSGKAGLYAGKAGAHRMPRKGRNRAMASFLGAGSGLPSGIATRALWSILASLLAVNHNDMEPHPAEAGAGHHV